MAWFVQVYVPAVTPSGATILINLEEAQVQYKHTDILFFSLIIKWAECSRICRISIILEGESNLQCRSILGAKGLAGRLATHTLIFSYSTSVIVLMYRHEHWRFFSR